MQHPSKTCKAQNYDLSTHSSGASQRPSLAWLPFSVVGSGLDCILGSVLGTLLARGWPTILPSKHAHQAREDITIHNSLCKWLNLPGDVHPRVQNGLIRRVEVRGTGLRQDLCAFRQVVDVEDPQKTQPHVLPGVILRLRSVRGFDENLPYTKWTIIPHSNAVVHLDLRIP